MRAVNLIPQDGHSTGSAGARPSLLTYVALGTLAGLVVLMTLYTLAGRDLTQGRSDLRQTQAQLSSAQAQAAALANVGSYAQLGAARAASVRSLAAARFPWSNTLDAVARLMPKSVRLSELSGAIAGGAPTTGTTTAVPTAPGASSGPAVTVQGCAPSQASVARLMPRLRAVPGVADVVLGSTLKAAAGSSAAAGKCARVTFSLTLAFAGLPGASSVPAPIAAGAAQ